MSSAARPQGRAASAPVGAPSPAAWPSAVGAARPRTAFLGADVHAVMAGDDLVLLDLPRARYLCLSEVGLAPGRRVAGPAERLAELEEAGLVAAAPRACSFAPRPTIPPVRTLAPARCAPTAARFAGAVADAALGYWGRPLEQLIREAAAGRRAAGDAPCEAALAAAARFRAVAPLLPLSAKCLLRSWLMLRDLRRRGHDAAWVFGVRTWPFRAHCWLQAGDVVLDDHWERVVGYSPILTV